MREILVTRRVNGRWLQNAESPVRCRTLGRSVIADTRQGKGKKVKNVAYAVRPAVRLVVRRSSRL